MRCEGVLVMKRRILTMLVAVLLVASIMAAPMSASASSKSMVQILKVTVDGARLREGPTSGYSIITSLDKGTKVFYRGKQKHSFCYVCTAYGQKGYIFRDFLASYGAAYASQIYYASSKVKVYKKASTGSGKVTTLGKGQHVILYQSNGDWAYIKTLGGKGGFVRASALKKAG